MLMGIKFTAQLESGHSQSNLLRSDINFENTRPYICDILEGVFHVSIIHSSVTTNEMLGFLEDRSKFGAVLFI